MTWSLRAALVVCTLSGIAPVAAQDWPQWRGPQRTGVVPAFREPAAWPASLTRRWTVDAGLGYATPILVGQRVYLFARRGEDEVMTAIDAATGTTIWRTGYPASFRMNPATERHGPGPKSTPAYADGRLFTLGMTGVVTAFDAATGRRLWQSARPAVEPLFHTATSPIVDGARVIVHVGGHDQGALTAFDTATGAVRWQWTGDGPAYGSPIVADLGGVRQIVTFTQTRLVGVEAATGHLLWSRPFTTQAVTTSQTPMIHRDTIIETGRGNGITAFRATQANGRWTTANVWHTDEVSVHMSDAVAVGGVLYGLSHLNSGQYFGVDLDTGRVLWKGPPRQGEHAAMAVSPTALFSLEEDGNLIVARHSRTGFEPVATYKVATTETWAQPVYSGTRVFVKDVSSLTLWTTD